MREREEKKRFYTIIKLSLGARLEKLPISDLGD